MCQHRKKPYWIIFLYIYNIILLLRYFVFRVNLDVPNYAQSMSSYDGVSFVSNSGLEGEAYHKWNSDAIHWNAPYQPYESFFLVMAITLDDIDSLHKDVFNTLNMLSYFQKHFSFKAVLFSKSRAALRLCEQHGITVITEFSTNNYSMPYCNFMLNQLRLLFNSEHYGYINSDILLSTELFHSLQECATMANKGLIKKNYLMAGRVQEVEIDAIPTFNSSVDDLDAMMSRLNNPSFQTLRHIHSADYFIFSKFIDLTQLKRVVVGRTRIDNYLLDIPRRQHGSLIDSSYQVVGVHQGSCGFLCRAKSKDLAFWDENWNRFYVISPRLGFGSLTRADYTFRKELKPKVNLLGIVFS